LSLAAVKDAVIRPYNPNLLAGVASEWKILNTAALGTNYTLPAFNATENLTVSGTVGVYTYLSGNCSNSPQTTLIPFLDFKLHKMHRKNMTTKPWGNGAKVVFGYGFTGEF
jgi:hypothetical protein